jgi:hypothetical protein
MRKFVYISNFKLLLISLLLASCSGILVPDPIDPRVPKYTEEGNNVAGAFVGENVWESIVYSSFSYTFNEPVVTVYSKTDSLSIRFPGSVNSETAIIEFHLKNRHITNFDDLLALNGLKIQLDGINATGYFIQDYTKSAFSSKGIGQVYFRSVKRDRSGHGIILSGTFGFTAKDSDNALTKVSSGRFDYVVWQNNFVTGY